MDDCVDAVLARWIREKLRRWFRVSARDLPWRKTRDPYRIWVAEVMLQQTQVETVIPYFERFTERFPNWTSLASAANDEVLNLWAGLGYYRRARNLHNAAKLIVAQHQGCVPRDAKTLQQMPGVGRYTAAAVLSQAFDVALPILEANSRRVLARVFGLSRADDRDLWQLSERLLPSRGAGEFNQALMELGALICRPAAPKCSCCPLVRRCAAAKQGLAGALGRGNRGQRPTPVEEIAFAVCYRGRWLLAQRPEEGRWAGMWEFPHVECRTGNEVENLGLLAKQLIGIQLRKFSLITSIRHSVTRYRITMRVFRAERTGGRFRSPFYVRGSWRTPAQIRQLPLSSPQRRLAKALQIV